MPSTRILIRTALLLLPLWAALPGRAPADTPAAAPQGARDPNIPALQDSTDLRAVIYSFHQMFKYDLNPDSTTYGTVEQFKTLYPDAYWEENLKKITNEDGSLAWTTSQDMLALVVMYDETGDAWFLRWLGRYAAAAMASRDDLAHKKNYAGHEEPGWGSSRYGDQKRRIYLVHSGLIIEPILEYAVRARARTDLTEAEKTKIQTLIDRCRETLLWHDYQLDRKAPAAEAVYTSGHEEPDRKAAWQPYNRQNLLARDFYLLYQLTGDESYRERSRKLYTFFKDHLELTPSEAYIWEYEPVGYLRVGRVAVCDDMSHATFSLEAVLHACQDDFVFSRADMIRFARTFTRYISMGDGMFQSSIGCRVGFQPRLMDRLFAWLPAAQADIQIYGQIRRFMLHNVEKPQPLAIAYLIAYRPKGMSGIDTRVH